MSACSFYFFNPGPRDPSAETVTHQGGASLQQHQHVNVEWFRTKNLRHKHRSYRNSNQAEFCVEVPPGQKSKKEWHNGWAVLSSGLPRGASGFLSFFLSFFGMGRQRRIRFIGDWDWAPACFTSRKGDYCPALACEPTLCESIDTNLSFHECECECECG
jgi:hypothetical protein